ncbi:MAG: ISKra4 family transposase [Candidatus Tectimicrobiota bacterium]
MTETVWHQRHARTGSLTETIVAHAHQSAYTRTQSNCPPCDRLLPARAPVSRTVETLGGPVQLARPYFYCGTCHAGVSPLDTVFGLTPGRKQLDVHKAAAKVATEVPYDEAHTLLRDLTGLGMSSERMPTLTHQGAEGLTVLDVAPSREEMAQRIAKVAAGKWRRPILVLGIDGASIPTRPDRARGRRPGQGRSRARRACWQGQWRDAKGLRFDLIDGERIVPLLRWHQVQKERERGEALRQVHAAGLLPMEQVRLCVVADGAEWIWKHVQAICPQARPVLDYYHWAQYIHNIAQAPYGPSVQARAWVEATMTRLSVGQVSVVLGGLRRMKPTADEAAQTMANGWEYLHAHRGRTHYRQFRRGGSPLGSGGIASANKFICHVRLKRSGAWWYEINSNQMLALRCAKYNGTLDQVFVRHQQRLWDA